MKKQILFAEMKVYAYLYLMTAPFTYLVYEIGESGPTDDFVLLNIFIALSLWVYIKKVQSLISERSVSGAKILLFLLVATAVLFSIKSMSLSKEIESEVSSIESDISHIQDDVSSIQDDVGNLIIYGHMTSDPSK